MKKTKYLFMALLFIISNAALATSPIQNMVDVPVPVNVDGSHPNLEEIKGAILSGCRKRGWMPLIDDERQITCSISVRSSHYAEVEIPYTEKSYSIYYKNSRDLDYNEQKQKIHRNYNKWVANLSSTILQECGVR